VEPPSSHFPLAARGRIRWRDGMWRGKTGKVLVVCSSLLLGCGYVGYRHQEQVKKPAGGKAVLPGSKNPNRLTVLPGSKSIDAVSSNPNRQISGDFILPEAPAGGPADRALLPGSKPGGVVKLGDAEAMKRENR
jgi:hypothetical protein